MYSEIVFKIACVLLVIVTGLITLCYVNLLPNRLVDTAIRVFKISGVILVVGFVLYIFNL